MGFWSTLKSFGSSIRRGVGRAIEAVGSVIPGRLGDKLEDIGLNMQYPKSPYDPGSATISETVDITAECKKACEDATKQAEPVIDEIVREGESILQKAWKDFSRNIPLEERDQKIVATCFSGLKQEYRDYIARRISVDNEEFLEAAKIESQTKREEAIQKYVKSVIHNVSRRIMALANEQKNEAIKKMLAILDEHLKSQEEEMHIGEQSLRILEENQDDAESIVGNLTDQIIHISYLKCIRSIARSKVE